jgi:hypothetical protein
VEKGKLKQFYDLLMGVYFAIYEENWKIKVSEYINISRTI